MIFLLGRIHSRPGPRVGQACSKLFHCSVKHMGDRVTWHGTQNTVSTKFLCHV
jgi:hypothetical protein